MKLRSICLAPISRAAAVLTFTCAASAVYAQDQTAATAADDREALKQRIEQLEKRLSDLESSAVLSEPETRVKQVEVYVDENGNEYDQPTPGAKKTVTYQRERVFRRQTISEKIEEALADDEARKVQLGINTAMVVQQISQTRGEDSEADGHAYALSSADLLFSAKLAQYTSLYADVVGLSGSPPDNEVGGYSLLNGYAARLQAQDQVYLREAWLRTQLFGEKLAVNIGRLDLTAFFDRNVAANDETSQFISDALVNNPMLGLGSNGAGVAAVYDPHGSFNVKVGLQQSDPEASNLSESMYTLGEVGYRARPFFLGEGNYRTWYRSDNSNDSRRSAYGVSLDQKITPIVTVFGRYGSAETATDRDYFYSTGLQFSNGWVLSPLDVWGVGYARTELAEANLMSPGDRKEEDLAEVYYNFHLSEKLRLSVHLTHVTETNADGSKQGFLAPGLRLQAGL